MLADTGQPVPKLLNEPQSALVRSVGRASTIELAKHDLQSSAG